MAHKNTIHTLSEKHIGTTTKREYASPQLVQYGAVRDLTRNGNGSGVESGATNCSGQPKSPVKNCAGSERRIKENIVRIGTHPLGIGLYLFDYLPQHRAKWGEGRQFGVMIDEVETVMPEAVSVDADGYKVVDYGMLGVSRSIH
jgi:hypothetical protein